MEKLKISIIVPVYSVEERLLRRCIESLLAQTQDGLEILLVDDGCPIDGGAICDEYAGEYPQIRVIHQENLGVSSARNAGLEIARGKYICFVDGDDFIPADYCKTLYNAAESCGADIVSCAADRYNPDTDTYTPYHPGHSGSYRDEEIQQLALSLLRNVRFHADELQLSINNYIWAHLYRASLLTGVRFNKQLRRGEDKLFNFQALKHCQVFCCVADTTYHYVINTQSLTKKFLPDALPMALATYRLYRNLPRVIQKPEYRQAHYIRTCRMVVEQATDYFLHPDNPEKQPIDAFRRFCQEDVVAEAIKNADIRKMRLSKLKLCIFCLKLGLYGPTVKLAKRFGL